MHSKPQKVLLINANILTSIRFVLLCRWLYSFDKETIFPCLYEWLLAILQSRTPIHPCKWHSDLKVTSYIVVLNHVSSFCIFFIVDLGAMNASVQSRSQRLLLEMTKTDIIVAFWESVEKEGTRGTLGSTTQQAASYNCNKYGQKAAEVQSKIHLKWCACYRVRLPISPASTFEDEFVFRACSSPQGNAVMGLENKVLINL